MLDIIYMRGYNIIIKIKKRRNKMKRQEFIAKKEKDIEIYKNAILKMESEIESLLDGKPEKFEKEDGMPGFHEKFNEIKKIRFEKCQIERRLMQAEELLREAKEEK